MSATNHTTNYELPVFVGTDKPAWLVDWNGAMTVIDTAIHTAEGKADQAGTDIGGIESSITTINGTLTSINNAVSQLRVDTNANTGSINTITSLIGNGEPTTTDKTIIGAINEINAEVYDFDLSAFDGSFNITSTFIVHQLSEVDYLLNADKSIGKIYGGIRIDDSNVSNGWTKIASLASSDMSPITNAYNIVIGFSNVTTSAGDNGVLKTRLHFNTNGTIDVELYATTPMSLHTTFVSLPACVYFLKDMGD